ncbi:hypothetical protein [Stratiformator vulcanicus]|uniref:Uncharacterized protein n=1 Tax=Stratiformator vulcanicus TaxID=2527980 RepID=A0A517R0P3_9PLAN|nr:hypothetical protein [Stratiformator vulcanicus]QDT37438.1 hypothetical protein Pan189_18180 [Stratiformator vulcanicus]
MPRDLPIDDALGRPAVTPTDLILAAATLSKEIDQTLEADQQRRDVAARSAWSSFRVLANAYESVLRRHCSTATLLELFTVDAAARVTASAFIAQDRNALRRRAAPVAIAIVDELELPKNTALHALLADEPAGLDRQLGDRFRRMSERWTDVLSGHLVTRFLAEEFVFDVDRAADFGGYEYQIGQRQGLGTAWPILLTGLELAWKRAVEDCNWKPSAGTQNLLVRAEQSIQDCVLLADTPVPLNHGPHRDRDGLSLGAPPLNRPNNES